MTPQKTLPSKQGHYALVAGYIAIWLLMTLLSAAALWYMASIQKQLHDIVEVHNSKKELVKELRESSRERAFSLQQMLLLDDPFEHDAETMKIYLNGSKIINAREQFMKLPLDTTEKDIFNSYKETIGRGAAAQGEVLNLIESYRLDQARHNLVTKVLPIQKEALAYLKELEDYQESVIKAALKQGERSYDRARTLLIILGAIAVILLLTIAIKVFRVIHEAARALHDEQDRLRVILHSIGDGVIATDKNGSIEYINPMASHFTGWRQEDAKGTHFFDVFHIFDASHQKHKANTLNELIDKSLANDPHHHCLLKRRDGLTFAVDFTTSIIHHIDGKIRGYVTIFRDESKLREIAQHLSHQATHDPLTNLANRREFERCLEQLIDADLQHGQHALCYLDLDRFKIVNDTCGHAAGDELLKQIVNLFRQKIRNDDLLARIGGDEFGLLLENCPIERALGIAEEIRKSVQRYRFIWKGQSFQIGVSMGMVVIDNRWMSLPELLAAADAACYAAKDCGRNRVHLYVSAEGPSISDDISWAVRIQSALEHDHLIHFYQKPVELRPPLTKAYYIDLQLRIMERGRQRLPFAPLVMQAERHGLAPLIDRWAVENALILALLREDKSAIYNIPLSAATLQDDRFRADIAKMAHERSVPPAQICLEFPENYLQANLQRASAVVADLKGKGFHVALCGAGVNTNLLDAFRSIPFDYLRISGDFIHEAMEDDFLHIQLEALVRMAHSIGWRVIAMDIQNRSMIDQLGELGVDYVSGHGIDKPQPAIALLIGDFPDNDYEPKLAGGSV